MIDMIIIIQQNMWLIRFHVYGEINYFSYGPMGAGGATGFFCTHQMVGLKLFMDHTVQTTRTWWTLPYQRWLFSWSICITEVHCIFYQACHPVYKGREADFIITDRLYIGLDILFADICIHLQFTVIVNASNSPDISLY